MNIKIFCKVFYFAFIKSKNCLLKQNRDNYFLHNYKNLHYLRKVFSNMGVFYDVSVYLHSSGIPQFLNFHNLLPGVFRWCDALILKFKMVNRFFKFRLLRFASTILNFADLNIFTSDFNSVMRKTPENEFSKNTILSLRLV